MVLLPDLYSSIKVGQSFLHGNMWFLRSDPKTLLVKRVSWPDAVLEFGLRFGFDSADLLGKFWYKLTLCMFDAEATVDANYGGPTEISIRCREGTVTLSGGTVTECADGFQDEASKPLEFPVSGDLGCYLFARTSAMMHRDNDAVAA